MDTDIYRTTAEPVLFTHCKCRRTHRSYRGAAACIWGEWCHKVYGDGRYALIRRCRPFGARGKHYYLTVRLFEDAASAEADASHECGGSCTGRHSIVKLSRSLTGQSLFARAGKKKAAA